MIKKINASDRFHLESDWLSAYWLFSFDRYYDPENLNFGPLRVFNHDQVQPSSGFPTHPHREMEIVTYILDGALTHQDSTGGRGLIHTGEVQRMTAGTGIAHSEINNSTDRAVRLLQMWVLPAEAGLTPSYDQKQFTSADRLGTLLPIASGQGIGESVNIHQDATFYVSTIRPTDHLSHSLKAGRRGFLYVIDGEITINGESFETGDQARITDTALVELTSSRNSDVILIDLP